MSAVVRLEVQGARWHREADRPVRAHGGFREALFIEAGDGCMFLWAEPGAWLHVGVVWDEAEGARGALRTDRGKVFV